MQQPLVARIFANQQVILFLVFAAMVAFFTSQNSIFFSTGVFGNVLLDWGPVVLVAVGETFVVISGGIDLSVGSTVGLAGVIGAFAMRNLTTGGHGEALTLLLGTLVCVGVGAAVGIVNALLINKARLVPFIATLATLGAGAGLTIVMTNGAPIAGGPPTAITLSNNWIGPLSKPIVIVIVLVVICGLFLHTARFGRYTFAIGSNPFAARAAGISVPWHLTKIYVLSGALSGLAGMFFYLRLGSGAPTSGAGLELDAIAAVVIGGASLAGGVGRLSGTVLGALILTTVTSGLIIIGVAPNWKKVVVAILIAAAVSTQALRTSRGSA
ncbi:ABC transporter permease [Nocardioides sp.]|uniref:ABC transporter permease n=1 Tax=Nocardioides sp. TaxID=35761 RepID=UPI00286D8E77|nr:ABC transporter permease [Nocardioides sp.]